MRFLSIYKIYMGCCFCLVYANMQAQQDLLPTQYGFTTLQNNFYNPSSFNKQHHLELQLGNQLYRGLLAKVENHYLLASFNISGKDSLRNSNKIGIKLVNEKEGDFIFKPRYYLSYTWSTNLSTSLLLAAGANLGVAGYTFRATNVSAGGSSSRPDADFGITLRSRSFELGASINQIFNNVLIPKEYQFKLRRFFTVYGEKSFDITENTRLTMYLQSIVFSTLKSNVGTSVTFKDFISFGTNFFVNERYSFLLGLNGIKLGNYQSTLNFGYNLPTFQGSQIKANSFELFLIIRSVR